MLNSTKEVGVSHSAPASNSTPAAAFRVLAEGARVLALARGHQLDKPIRDNSSSEAAQCSRCGLWYLVTVSVIEGGQDPVTGKAVRERCPSMSRSAVQGLLRRQQRGQERHGEQQGSAAVAKSDHLQRVSRPERRGSGNSEGTGCEGGDEGLSPEAFRGGS